MLKALAKLIWTRPSEHFIIERISATAAALFGAGSAKRFIALVVAIAELSLTLVLDTGVTPYGEELDLTGYELVFCDEFEGNSLNTDAWAYRASGSRRGGFNAPSQVKVDNGKMIITGEYLENGAYGEGWYTGMVRLKEEYTRGYFEIKCICSGNEGFWSAFWLQSPNAYDPAASKGGVGGAEIDIFESMGDNLLNKNTVLQTIHLAGLDGNLENELQSLTAARAKANNIREEYNTYGLEWTEDEYIFYVNGVESARTSFGNGVSTTPEEVIVSLELSSDFSGVSKDYKTQMTVDYVKIYQMK